MGVQVIKSLGLANFFGLDFARKTCNAARLGFGRAVNNVYMSILPAKCSFSLKTAIPMVD